MTEPGDGPRARLLDLFHPRRLFAGIEARPGFVVPALVLVVGAMIYGQLALGVALPRIVPELLEHSVETESRFARDFRALVLTISVIAPLFFVLLAAFGSWSVLRAVGGRRPFFLVLSLTAHAALWAAIGLAVKGFLVLATGDQEPPVNLALFLEHPTRAQRVTLAFTNPFLLLAMAWTVRGLRAWACGRVASVLAGVTPWALWIVFSSLGSGGTSGVFAPSGPVSYEGWGTIEKPSLVLRHPPEITAVAEKLATILDDYTAKLGERFGFEPAPIRIRLFASHEALERATGEFLHVKLTGSIRGRDLLFLEVPGRSVALPKVNGTYEAIRYVGLMHLPFAPGLESAPRWFLEGLAHAAIPYSPELENEYRAYLRREGIPSFDLLIEPATFRTPDGPLLARAVVDHLVFRNGPAILGQLQADMANGASFRDALFARTRLTTSALEAEWQDAAIAILRAEPLPADSSAAPTIPAAPDSGRPVTVTPFLERQ